jgi:hypothetical protein
MKDKDKLDELQYFSQESLKKVWFNAKDDVWNRYLK